LEVIHKEQNNNTVWSFKYCAHENNLIFWDKPFKFMSPLNTVDMHITTVRRSAMFIVSLHDWLKEENKEIYF